MNLELILVFFYSYFLGSIPFGLLITKIFLKKALKFRDFSDTNRKESPLLFVKGAVLVDTTNLTKKKMGAKLFKLVEQSINTKYGNI